MVKQNVLAKLLFSFWENIKNLKKLHKLSVKHVNLPELSFFHKNIPQLMQSFLNKEPEL